jgi:hypothetical protein
MTGIAHVYLHKNVPDDEIAFTCTFLFHRFYQLNVWGKINRKLMPEITYLPVQSTQLQYTCTKRIRKRARLGLCCQLLARSFCQIGRGETFSNLGKKCSKMRMKKISTLLQYTIKKKEVNSSTPFFDHT